MVSWHNIVFFLNNVVFNVIEAYLMLLLTLYLLDMRDYLKKEKLRVFVYLLLEELIIYFASNYMPGGIHTVLIILASTLVLNVLLRHNIFEVFITLLMYLVVAMITECAFMALFLLIVHKSISYLNNAGANIEITVICFAIDYVFVFVLYMRPLPPQLKFSNLFKKGSSVISLILFQLSTLTIIIVCTYYALLTKKNIMVYQIALFAMFILFAVLNCFELIEREKMIKKNSELELQQAAISNLQSVVAVVRKEKHDYLNHLNTILAICVLNKPDTIAKIKSYITNISNSQSLSHVMFNSGNEYIDGLLAVKSSAASEHGIDLTAEFETLLDGLSIPDSELVSIFSNIIDNAFDALKSDTSEARRKMYIAAHKKNLNLAISFSNNGPMIPQEVLNRIFESGYSTKGPENERGYGLYIVNQIVAANKGSISVSSSAGKTEFIVSFPAEIAQVEML